MCSRRSCNCASHRIRSHREGNSTSEGHSTSTAHTQQASMERARAAKTPGGRGSGKGGLQAAAEPRQELDVFRDALPHDKAQAEGGGAAHKKTANDRCKKIGRWFVQKKRAGTAERGRASMLLAAWRQHASVECCSRRQVSDRH